MTDYKVLNPNSEEAGFGVGVTTTEYFEDITFNQRALENLVTECNRSQVEAVDFLDILEEFLSDPKNL